MELIDKDALVAEIERRIEEITQTISLGDKKIQKSGGNRRAELVRFLSFLDTLEVKEVDLEKEIELIKGDYEQVDVAWNNDFDFIAKHFFELGIKASQKGE